MDASLTHALVATRQWSRALPSGPRPAGRYGHSLNIIGSKIYIFGGQVEDNFMNDLSAFDLNQLQMPNNRWEILLQGDTSPKTPVGRTNHSMVTFNDKMYLYVYAVLPYELVDADRLQIWWYKWFPMV